MGYKIGLDISGGDYAPVEIIEGALMARSEIGEDIVLIGASKEINDYAASRRVSLDGFTIIDAPEKIGMDEPPAVTVRKKKNSSISVGSLLLRDKKIDAFVSCGNTGAVVCAAALSAGVIEGVERPGIAITLPTKKGVSLLIDAGANIDCRPLHLLQYAVMASVYCHLVMGKSNPVIGMLNIGEEDYKGTGLYKTTNKLLAASKLNFIGNIDAKNIFAGNCDCIVCDGVMGNIALKVAEGCADFVMRSFAGAGKRGIMSMLGMLMMKGVLLDFKKSVDYAEYGGAPLLGIDGIVIKGHGRSKRLAVKNAIKAAAKELSQHLNEEIKKKINEVCGDKAIKDILAA